MSDSKVLRLLKRINPVTKFFQHRLKGKTKSQTVKLVTGDTVCTWRTINDLASELLTDKIKKRRAEQVVDSADAVTFKRVTRDV